MSTDSTLALSFTRTDDRRPIVELVCPMTDVETLQGPGRKVLLAGAGSTEVNLWTSSLDGNGSAFTTLPFNRLVLAVDPDTALDDETKGIWVKPYYTAVAGGSSTAATDWHFVTRKCPLVMGPTIGTSISGGRVVTKLGGFNANASDDVTLILAVE